MGVALRLSGMDRCRPNGRSLWAGNAGQDLGPSVALDRSAHVPPLLSARIDVLPARRFELGSNLSPGAREPGALLVVLAGVFRLEQSSRIRICRRSLGMLAIVAALLFDLSGAVAAGCPVDLCSL